jgi:hypothetical protein
LQRTLFYELLTAIPLARDDPVARADGHRIPHQFHRIQKALRYHPVKLNRLHALCVATDFKNAIEEYAGANNSAKIVREIARS